MDIPLANAQVIWDHPAKGERPSIEPPIHVMTIGDKDDPRYDCSWGACNADFNAADDQTKLLMLFQQFHQIVVLYGIDAGAVHEAFMVIPEYRANIAVDLDPHRHDDLD